VADQARLMDNKSAESDYDVEVLVKELSKFNSVQIIDTGFSADDLQGMIMQLENSIDFGSIDDSEDDSFDEENEDKLPDDEEIETRVKNGDIWRLGNHFILCGDCTIERNIKALLGDEQIELLFTSPPYSDMRNYEDGTDISISKLNKIFSVWNDYVNFFAVNLGLKFNESELVEYWQEWIKEAKKQGLKLLAWNVWDKTTGGSIASATNMFLLTHEWIFVFGESRKRLNRTIPNQLAKYEARFGKDFLNGIQDNKIRLQDGSFSKINSPAYTHHQLHSVIQQTPELGKIRSSHPATMPVGLPQQYIEAMTNENDIVADCFLGSGTTLIACEKTNRICYGTELSEKYCDVILKRWENLTGQTAIFIKNI
jgi:DNA modification methylase